MANALAEDVKNKISTHQKILYKRIKRIKSINDIKIGVLEDSIAGIELYYKDLPTVILKRYAAQEIRQLKGIMGLKNNFDAGRIPEKDANEELKRRIKALKTCIPYIEAAMK